MQANTVTVSQGTETSDHVYINHCMVYNYSPNDSLCISKANKEMSCTELPFLLLLIISSFLTYNLSSCELGHPPITTISVICFLEIMHVEAWMLHCKNFKLMARIAVLMMQLFLHLCQAYSRYITKYAV
jgi:hypothetical protein